MTMLLGLLAATSQVHAIPVAGDYFLTSAVLTGTFTSTGTDIPTFAFTTTPFEYRFASEFKSPSGLTSSYNPSNDTLIYGGFLGYPGETLHTESVNLTIAF